MRVYMCAGDSREQTFLSLLNRAVIALKRVVPSEAMNFEGKMYYFCLCNLFVECSALPIYNFFLPFSWRIGNKIAIYVPVMVSVEFDLIKTRFFRHFRANRKRSAKHECIY